MEAWRLRSRSKEAAPLLSTFETIICCMLELGYTIDANLNHLRVG